MNNFSNLARSAQFEAHQFKILTKHFFLRLFKNDLVDFEDQMIERVIGIFSILAVFCGLIAFALFGKYNFVPDRGQSWIEKMFIITFFMLIMGFLAIIDWDVMFPDNRDYANLNPLPLRIRTILAAKFTSLTLFVGLFALSMNLFSSIFYLLFLPQWRSSGIFFFIFNALVHFIVMFSACFFSFFFYVVLLGLFQSLLGPRFFARVSTYIRSFFLIIQIFLALTCVRILVFGIDNFIAIRSINLYSNKFERIFDYFPPFWFTDLYETVLGSPKLPFHGRYKYALVSLANMGIIFILTLGMNYGQAIQLNNNCSRIKKKKILRFIEAAFNSLFLRNLVQRAVFHFFRKTLKSSVFHKMRLASYLACGIALVPFLITFQSVQKSRFFGVNLTLVSIPIIIIIALLFGLKSAINVPVQLEANWVFRLTEKQHISAYFAGLRKAIIILNIAPLILFVFSIYVFLWNPQIAFNFSLYCFLISIIVMEILFVQFIKIPFTCSYLPGKEKIHMYWILYLGGFIISVMIISYIGLELLKSPVMFLFIIILTILFVTMIRLYQTMVLYKRERIQFEEEPDSIMIGLDYKFPSHRRVG